MTVGRPKEFDPEEALDQAMRVFWRWGYEATSLQDLLGATGLSKSSFYQTFDSKHELFVRCVRRYRKELEDEMRTQLEQSDSGREFVSAALRGVARETRGPNARRGCLLMNTASEFSQSDPVIARLVGDGIRALTDLFEQAVRKGQQAGDISTGKDPRALASYCVATLGGLKNVVKGGVDSKTVEQIADVALSALE